MIAMTSPRPRPTPRPPAPPVGPPVVPPPVPRADYTETVVAPVQIALGVLVAVVAGAILLALGLWPLAVLAVLLVVAVSVYLGVQTLTVTPTRISIAQGRGDKSPHTVEMADVTLTEAVTLTWPQCFGLNLPATVDSTRFTVRAGSALSLTKRDGEQLRISAADPEAARAVLGR
jgi:hypothetical protein